MAQTGDISVVADKVSVVAYTRAPRVAFGAKVEFPPDAVEDTGARVTAVHLRGNGEVGSYLSVGVSVWLWGVGLDGRRTIGWISFDRDFVVYCACCGLERILRLESMHVRVNLRSPECSHCKILSWSIAADGEMQEHELEICEGG